MEGEPTVFFPENGKGRFVEVAARCKPAVAIHSGEFSLGAGESRAGGGNGGFGREWKRAGKELEGIAGASYDRSMPKAAQHELMNSRESIKGIAFRLGFQTSESFSRWFHQHTGFPPRIFREFLD